MVERTYTEAWSIVPDDVGAAECARLVERNGDLGVTWLCSYVSIDRKKSFCVYEAPSPEAIRKTSGRNELPVDRITQVGVLDPYFWH
jgi:hypothetical protein